MLVLGPDYAPAAAGLAILIWALPGAFMADTMLHLLAAQRRQSVSARAVAITALFNVAINLTLIPYFSYLGASATTVASEALSFALMYLAFGRSVPRIGLFGVARAPLIAGGIAAATMVLLSPLDPGGAWGIALMGTFAMAAYILALVALGALGAAAAKASTRRSSPRPCGRASGESGAPRHHGEGAGVRTLGSGRLHRMLSSLGQCLPACTRGSSSSPPRTSPSTRTRASSLPSSRFSSSSCT